MKECDIFGGSKHTLTPPTYFQRVRTPNPHDVLRLAGRRLGWLHHPMILSAPSTSEVNKLCAWRHNMPPPLQVDNIFAFIRQVAPVVAM